MQRWHAFSQLILARIREFYREPETIFWVYGFPLILAIGLGIAFSNNQSEPPKVDVQDQPNPARAQALKEQLLKHKVEAKILSAHDCDARRRSGQSSLTLIAKPDDQFDYQYDQNRPEGELARRWVEAALLRDRVGPEACAVNPIPETEPGSRYIDFLLPGLIGMNIMGGGLFGIGFVLVDMRVRKLFKRLLATPMHRGDFLLSLLSARMLFLAPEMIALLLLGWLAFDIPLRGSIFCLSFVIVLGALAFAGIGLLVASRTDKTETISGLINLVMLPMYLLSGIFFSSKRFPDLAQPYIQALPLTQLNDALREVMLEGKSFTEIVWRLAILGTWAVGSFALALRWFRWR